MSLYLNKAIQAEYEEFEQWLVATKLDKNYVAHAKQILQQSMRFDLEQAKKSRAMFGYPCNMVELSPLTRFLYSRHAKDPLSNNCGDIFEQGNYQMDSKEIEIQIIKLFSDKFGAGEDFWGYITSGGTESNCCGIDMAFAKHPDGILYFSQSAHYSVPKHAKHYKYQVILDQPSNNEEINVRLLLETVLGNYQSMGAPANIVLTFGTTKYGACDDIDEIISQLNLHHIPYYIHVDAATFGGIPNNQINAPILTGIKQRGVDSVSVSLHKYLGFPDVKSVFVSTQKPNGKFVPYIGQTDSTTSGSRSVPALALYNHTKEMFEMQPPRSYTSNVELFEGMLNTLKIPFFRNGKSNVFVIDKPNERVSRDFQLSCFKDKFMNDKAHIIIFPYHAEKDMFALVEALATS